MSNFIVNGKGSSIKQVNKRQNYEVLKLIDETLFSADTFGNNFWGEAEVLRDNLEDYSPCPAPFTQEYKNFKKENNYVDTH